MKLSLSRLQKGLIYLFVFVGPLGSLVSFPGLPQAFRLYYCILIAAPLLLVNLRSREWKTLMIFFPFFAYCLISACLTQNKADTINPDALPVFRYSLFVMQYLFMFGASFCLQRENTQVEKKRLLTLYLTGFFISLITGYVLHIGYYSQKISFHSLSTWCVEAQIAWNFLRFSPGSYPNEYGNVSSFVLVTLILLVAQKRRIPIWLHIFIILTFTALILTTTRSAYLTFLITTFYLFITLRSTRMTLLQLGALGVGLALFLVNYYSFDIVYIFKAGMYQAILGQQSMGTRLQEWVYGFHQFSHSVLFGTGFGAHIEMHNVYLELVYELGIIGTLILVASLFYYWTENSAALISIFSPSKWTSETRLYRCITVVGLIHILFFALNNHNMHHHLTWLIFMFFNMDLFDERARYRTATHASDQQHLSYTQRHAPQR